MEGLRGFSKTHLGGGFYDQAAGGQTGGRVGTGFDGHVDVFLGEIDHLEEDLAVRRHILGDVHGVGAILRLELADLGLSRHAAGDVLVDLAVGVGFEGQDVAEVIGAHVPELGIVGGGEGADNAAHLQGRQGDGGGAGREGGGRRGRCAGDRGRGGCAGRRRCGAGGRCTGR